MCMYKKYASREWGDDVEVFSGPFLPIRLVCSDCKLHPEGKGSYHTLNYTEEDHIPEDIRARTMYGGIVEAPYRQMINHLEKHQKAGHRVHPMVIEQLADEMIKTGEWSVFGEKFALVMKGEL